MRAIGIAVLLATSTLPHPASFAMERSSDPNDGVDLRELIESASTRLHKRFIVDPRVSGTVTLAGLDPNELTYEELQSILSMHGFVTTPERNGTIEIVPDANARQLPAPVLTEKPSNIGRDDMVTKTLEVGSLDAVQLVPILRPLLPQYAHLVAHQETNSLLVVARQENVATLEAVIRDLQRRPSREAKEAPGRQ